VRNKSTDKPLFLTGVYRSGTTLIAQVLNNHPDLRVISDSLHFFRYFLSQKYRPINESYKSIVSDTANRLSVRYDVKVPQYEIIKRLETLPDIEFKDVYQALMVETFCNGRDDVRWGEKSLLQWTNIPLFLQMYRDGQVLHIIRDPRDVLASFREATNEEPHRYLDAIFCCLHSLNWAETIGSSLPKDRYKVVRHEDLVTTPQTTCMDISDFLGIRYDPVMLDASKFVDARSRPWSGDSSFGDIFQQIVSTSVGRWRSSLSPYELLFSESIMGNLMTRFGYELSGTKTGISAWQQLWSSLNSTPLIKDRLVHWLETGQVIELYPSDPTDPDNWAEPT